MTVGAPSPPPTQTTFSPVTGLNGRRNGLPAGLLAGRRPSRSGLPALRDVVPLRDLDTLAFRRLHDLLAGGLLLRAGLEVGLVEPGHGVPDMRVVIDGEMSFSLLVDVGELPFVHLLPVFGVELSHRGPPSLFFKRSAAHTVPVFDRGSDGAAETLSSRRGRLPVASLRAQGPLPLGPSVAPSHATRPEGNR